jgi:hypothetical protein
MDSDSELDREIDAELGPTRARVLFDDDDAGAEQRPLLEGRTMTGPDAAQERDSVDVH